MTTGDREGDKFVLQMMYMLQAPMMGMPMWLDTLRMHRDDITLQRLGHHKEIFESPAVY